MNSELVLRGFVGGLFQGFFLVWPLWLLMGLIFAVKTAVRLREKRRLAASGIEDIDRMDGRTFEKYLEVLFGNLGYAVERTRYIGDYGADLVVRKDGVKTVVQAKRNKRSIGVKAIQEAVAAKGYYDCAAAMVVTNSTYTKQAVELARKNGVALWDRERLITALLSANTSPDATVAVQPIPNPVASTETQATPATVSGDQQCATCGKALSEKVVAYCQANAPRFHGEVYCYEHQRARARTSAGSGPG